MREEHTRLSEEVMASGSEGWITARANDLWLDHFRLSKTAGYCWRTLKSHKFYPVYSFFEPKGAWNIACRHVGLRIEMGSPTVSKGFWDRIWEVLQKTFGYCWRIQKTRILVA
jgi:hypothetical protein